AGETTCESQPPGGVEMAPAFFTLTTHKSGRSVTITITSGADVTSQTWIHVHDRAVENTTDGWPFREFVWRVALPPVGTAVAITYMPSKPYKKGTRTVEV